MSRVGTRVPGESSLQTKLEIGYYNLSFLLYPLYLMIALQCLSIGVIVAFSALAPVQLGYPLLNKIFR
jgi:hypothetical protein